MIELLEYLAANGFTSYIASGGDRDFMRPITEALYGIPSERVIGSSNALRYEPDEHGLDRVPDRAGCVRRHQQLT
jgi:phosphoglycolate phosphatase-like HAD superfamily hydrolase